jgi:hypothetical protein
MQTGLTVMLPAKPGAQRSFNCPTTIFHILKSSIMKNGLHLNPIMLKAVLLLTCFMLVMFYNKAKAQTQVHIQQTAEQIQQ